MTLEKYLSNFEFMTSDKPDLVAMEWFMKELNNPNEKLKFIHVAGTNGKGSICEMLNKILFLSNYTVGKYISPYLVTANEAICINNNYFSKEDEEKYLPQIDLLVKKYISIFNKKPSKFEIETTLALLYFYDKNCDIVILEVGLGGKYDCTNIINSSISVFGSISIDHTNILGNSLEEITYQKAGIIKENCKTVIFEQPASKLIDKICKQKNNEITIVKKTALSNIKIHNNIKSTTSNFIKDNNLYQSFDYKNFKNIKLNLLGKKQLENASVVLEVIEILKKQGFKTNEEIIKNALCSITHPARFEILSNTPKIIFDGAHNENAIDNFVETIKDYFEGTSSITFIISIIKNKDYKTIISKLGSNFKSAKLIFTDGTKEEKYLSKEILYDFAKKYSNCSIADDLEHAIKLLDSDINFIVGSFYTYKLVKSILQ